MGFGIRPAKKSLSFIPDQIQEHSFRVMNEDLSETAIKLSTSGDLSDYIILPFETVTFDGLEKIINYRLDLSGDIEPGNHEGVILVEQLLLDDASAISTRLALSYKLSLNVPFPNKSITADLNVITNNKEHIFNVSLTNTGNRNIEKIKLNLNIYEGETLTHSFKPKSNSINIAGSKTFEFSVKKGAISNGRYAAIIDVEYDDEFKTIEQIFDLGKPEIGLNIPETNFRPGTINKIDLEFNNLWNQKVFDIYADIDFMDSNSRILSSLTTYSFDIESRGIKSVDSYWDATNFTYGNYKAQVTIYSGNLTSTKTFEVSLLTDTQRRELIMRDNRTQAFTFIFVALVLVLSILLYLLYGKRKKRKP